MEEHVITRERGGGTGPMGWIRPKCSCGWVGEKVHHYEDEQYYNLQEQEFDHKERIK